MTPCTFPGRPSLIRDKKQASASRKSTTMKSKTDWARLKSDAGDVKATLEHPEAAVNHIVRGMVRKGLKPLPAKASISLREDQDVLEWFKGLAIRPESPQS